MPKRLVYVSERLGKEVDDCAARLGVMPGAVVRAAIRCQLDAIREDDVVACSDPELMEAWERSRVAERARRALAS